MTKDHLEMFAKAKEIQEGWKPEGGDAIVCIDSICSLYIDGLETGVIKQTLVFGDIDGCRNIKHHICIFSTDQLAEIWFEEKGTITNRSVRFIHQMWEFACDKEMLSTPLQVIALHFVMSDLFNLTWDSENERWR